MGSLAYMWYLMRLGEVGVQNVRGCVQTFVLTNTPNVSMSIYPRRRFTKPHLVFVNGLYYGHSVILNHNDLGAPMQVAPT